MARFLRDRPSRVLRQSPGLLVFAGFRQFLDFGLPFVGKSPQFLMLLVAVAHSFFRDPVGFSFQFPGFLVFAGFGQFLDLAGSLLHPSLERVCVMVAFAMFGVLALTMLVAFASLAIFF